MIIPEVIIEKGLNDFLIFLNEDIKKINDGETNKSWLFNLLKNEDDSLIKFDNYEFFKQSLTVFKQKESDKNLSINIGYNLKRAELPTIHILMPSDNVISKGIGERIGYQENKNIGDETSEIMSELTNSNYFLLITSPNINEVLLIYYVIKAGLIAMFEYYEQSGFNNVMIGGADVQIQPDLVPAHIFHRSMSLTFSYDFNVPSLKFQKIIRGTNLKPTGIPIETQL